MITDLHTFNMSEKSVYLQWTVKHILLIGPLKKSCKVEDFTDRPKHMKTMEKNRSGEGMVVEW